MQKPLGKTVLPGGFCVIFRGVILYPGAPPSERSTAMENCSLKRVEAYEQAVELNTHVLGDHAVSVQMANRFSYLPIIQYGLGNTPILFENGVFTQHDTAGLADNNYNDPVNRYFLKDDGTPGFECRPQKYLFTGATEDLLIYARSETNCAAQKALRRRRTESRY